jgi:hypothetical protein
MLTLKYKPSGEPTQPTQPKGHDKDGEPFEPVEIPVPKKGEVLGALERAAKPAQPPSES